MAIAIDYTGKVALITGAAQGIGFATAKAFAEAGACVVLADVIPEVEAAAEEIRKQGGAAVHCFTDVSDSAACKSMVELAIEEYGRLDFAFNNAGIGSYGAAVSDVEDSDWTRLIDINLTGVFYCIKHEVPAMLKSGGGVIINTSSVLGVRALPGCSVQYTAAKHGVIGLTRQVAINHAAEGIRCLAICPGFVDTELTSGPVEKGGADAESRQFLMDRIPQNRFGSPEDMAGTVLMLCGEQSAYVNGTHLMVDGGLIQG